MADYVVQGAGSRIVRAALKQLGYSSAAWKVLADDIRDLLENVVENTVETEFGTKYEVRGRLEGPSGKLANVVTVWVVLKGEGFSRFVTAYPGET